MPCWVRELHRRWGYFIPRVIWCLATWPFKRTADPVWPFPESRKPRWCVRLLQAVR